MARGSLSQPLRALEKIYAVLEVSAILDNLPYWKIFAAPRKPPLVKNLGHKKYQYFSQRGVKWQQGFGAGRCWK